MNDSSVTPWHLLLVPGREDVQSTESFEWQSRVWPLLPRPEPLSRKTFTVSFDGLFARLAGWVGFYGELDGSFTWRNNEENWLIEGQALEWEDCLLNLELKGNAPPKTIEPILIELGWPTQPIEMDLLLPGLRISADTWMQ